MFSTVILIKGILCYFESNTAFSQPPAVNHFKHMLTRLFLPTHFQLSPAPTQNNNKHLVHPHRGNWKWVRCINRSRSYEKINHTAFLIIYHTAHTLTQHTGLIFQVHILFYCESKQRFQKSTGKIQQWCLLLTGYIKYILKAKQLNLN